LEMSVFPKISLAIEEALANVIMYAYPESQDGLVSLVASVADSTLYFKICDSGKQFNPLLHQESNLSSKLEERSIGGLGIHIIKEVMDALEYEYNDFQNTLLMSKKI
ncbi:MAG: ATP-binding protein, partial [Bacteroidales bacterium]|nr:ATP-binding protein [Bacteroidales bacterium]